MAFGLYEMSVELYEEMAMYFLVGFAFFVTWGSYRPELKPSMKKFLTILSWVIIISAGLVFLFMVRTDAQR